MFVSTAHVAIRIVNQFMPITSFILTFKLDGDIECVCVCECLYRGYSALYNWLMLVQMQTYLSTFALRAPTEFRISGPSLLFFPLFYWRICIIQNMNIKED